MADPGTEGNRVLVGLPDRLNKYRQIIRQYQGREQSLVLLVAGLSSGMIEVPTFIHEASELLQSPVKVEPPLDAPDET